MKFDMNQRFDASPTEVIAVYADPDFYLKAGAVGPLSAPELVAHEIDGDAVSVDLRYAYQGDLPPGAGRFVQRDKMTWVQKNRIDLAKATLDATIVADNYAKRLQAKALARLTADGDGTLRKVSGEVRVKIMMVGGKVEGAIVGGLKEHLDEEAKLVVARLA
jgi:hypothetical protein